MKMNENLIPGNSFWAKEWFWDVLGISKGTQKWPKIEPELPNQSSIGGGDVPGSSQNQFLMIFAWFWNDFRVPRWSILEPSGVLFGGKPLHRETYASNTRKQQQIEVNIATKLHRFIARSSSKQQQIAANSSNQQQLATNSSKYQQVARNSSH